MDKVNLNTAVAIEFLEGVFGRYCQVFPRHDYTLGEKTLLIGELLLTLGHNLDATPLDAYTDVHIAIVALRGLRHDLEKIINEEAEAIINYKKGKNGGFN